MKLPIIYRRTWGLFFAVISLYLFLTNSGNYAISCGVPQYELYIAPFTDIFRLTILFLCLTTSAIAVALYIIDIIELRKKKESKNIAFWIFTLLTLISSLNLLIYGISFLFYSLGMIHQPSGSVCHIIP